MTLESGFLGLSSWKTEFKPFESRFLSVWDGRSQDGEGGRVVELKRFGPLDGVCVCVRVYVCV